jgi:hypothetical protein
MLDLMGYTQSLVNESPYAEPAVNIISRQSSDMLRDHPVFLLIFSPPSLFA